MYLNSQDSLVPFISKSNKKFLTQCFADDLNLTTGSQNTLLRVFRILEEFRSVSGLKVNYEKTKGIYFNKSGQINIDFLPLSSSNWNCNMNILGIPYGTADFIDSFWNNILCDIKHNLNMYNNVYSTFDAKSIITKSLILPKVSYAASVMNIPSSVKKSIDNLVFRYVIPKGKMGVTLTKLAKKTCLWGL